MLDRTKIERVCDRIIRVSIFIFTASMPFSITLTQSAFGLALLAWIAKMISRKTILIRKTALDLPFLMYLAAEVISLIFSINVPNAVVYFKRMLLIPMVYLVANNVTDQKLMRRLISVFILSVSMYSLWGIVSYVYNPTVRVRHIQNSMTTGGMTMIGTIICLSSFLYEINVQRKLLFGAAALVNWVCLLLTFTRGSWLGLGFAMIILLGLTNRKLLLSVPAAIVVLYLLLPNSVVERGKSIFDPKQPTIALRWMWWKTGWKIIEDHPITGVGDIATGNIYAKYMPPESKEIVGHFHNNFVQIGVTLGIVGIMAFSFLMIRIFYLELSIFKHIRQKAKFPTGTALGSLAVFVAFNVNGLFEWNFGDAEIVTLLWFTVGLSIAVKQLRPSHQVSSEQNHKTLA